MSVKTGAHSVYDLHVHLEGEKRPADVIGAAVMIGKIATGEVEESSPLASARKGGLKGGKGRAKSLADEQRSEIARVAAQARWKKSN